MNEGMQSAYGITHHPMDTIKVPLSQISPMPEARRRTVTIPEKLREEYFGKDISTAVVVGREWGPGNHRLKIKCAGWVCWIIPVGSNVTTCSPKPIAESEIK